MSKKRKVGNTTTPEPNVKIGNTYKNLSDFIYIGLTRYPYLACGQLNKPS